MEILDFNTNYFGIMDGNTKVKKITPAVKDTLKIWLGIKGDKVEPNGYLDKLVESGEARNMVKSNVTTQLPEQGERGGYYDGDRHGIIFGDRVS